MSSTAAIWLAVTVASRLPASLAKTTRDLIVMALVAAAYAASLAVLVGFDRPINRWREAWVARRLVTPGETQRRTAWRHQGRE